MRNFAVSYLNSEPVIATLPSGGKLLVLGWIGRPSGVSFADDGILDDWSAGHFPLHHLDGAVTADDRSLFCNGVEFRLAMHADEIKVWDQLMAGRDPAAVRARAEQMLRDDALQRAINRTK
jgi:hypothetical protein